MTSAEHARASGSETEAAPDPWSPAPALDGPTWLRSATRHEVALADAVQRKSLVFGEVQAQEHHAIAQHNHEEAIRRAEHRMLVRRVDRLEARREVEKPILRDGALGFVGSFAPFALLVNGSRLDGTARKAAYVLAAAAAAFAGHEFMEHAHRRRVAQLEDELDRCESRAAVKAIPHPSPPRSHVLDRLLQGQR